TEDSEASSRPSDDMARSESSNSISSPIDQRNAFTPTVAKGNPWVSGGFETRARAWSGDKKPRTKRTAAGIPTWSPTVVLICRSTAYVWQSGRDAQFSADCGRT
ncbi:hypothetical protein KCU73_g14620, partial [Aureobasidium melanogenum]